MGLFLCLIPVALYFLYKWSTATFDYFEKQGFAFQKPLPLLGSDFHLFFKKQPMAVSLMNNYNKHKSEK